MFLKSLFIYEKCFNFSSPTEPACVLIRSFVITENDTFPIQISIKVMPELSGSRCPSAHKWNDLLISFHHHSCTHSALGGDENCLSKIWQGGVAVGAHINLHAFIATTTMQYHRCFKLKLCRRTIKEWILCNGRTWILSSAYRSLSVLAHRCIILLQGCEIVGYLSLICKQLTAATAHYWSRVCECVPVFIAWLIGPECPVYPCVCAWPAQIWPGSIITGSGS